MNLTRKYSIIINILFIILSGYFISSPVFAENPADIEIVETSLDSGGQIVPWHDITGAMPGDIYDLSPSVVNHGTEPVKVSICITKSGQNNVGDPIDIPNNTFLIDFSSHWNKQTGANCFDYNKELQPEATTAPLFEKVSINSELGNEYQNASFNLVLTATSIAGEPDTPEPIEPTPTPPDTGFITFISSALPSISVLAVIISFTIIIIISFSHKNRG